MRGAKGNKSKKTQYRKYGSQKGIQLTGVFLNHFVCFLVFLRPIIVRLKLINVVITTHNLMLLNTELK